jgi:hypothetical protein
MKKLLLLSVAVLAVFSLAFTACDSAVGSTTVTQGYSKLDNPKIQTKVYPGAVVVTWKPVKDAEGYFASRIDNTTLEVTDLTAAVETAVAAGGGTVRLVDIVNYGNELVNGRSYTYVVTAYNALSIGYGGATLTTPPANPVDGGSGDVLPVLNGQSEATIKANVPATITFPTLAETNITLETFSNLDASAEFLKVSYPKIPDNQYNPGISLQLTYSYGSENTDKLPIGNYAFTTTVKGAGYAVFPLIGGINTVKARYIWDENNTSYANTFYVGPAAVTKATENLAKTVLPTVALSAAIGTDGRAAPYVTLQYTYNATSPSRELTGDITPVVYRAEVIGKAATVTSSSNSGTTVGGWTALTTTWKDQTAFFNGQDVSTYTRYAEDTTVEKGSTYAYLLVLTTPTQTTVPSISALTSPIPDVLPKAPTLTAVNVSVTLNRESSGLAVVPPTYGIAVSWQGDKTSTYKLFRAPNIGTNDSTDAKPGDWTEITVPAKDDLDKYSYYDNTGLQVRTSYYYKVIGTNDGIEYTRTVLAASGVYTIGSASLTGSLTAVVGPGTSAVPTTLVAGEVSLIISQQTANQYLLAAAETVRIYYWPTSNPAQFASAEYEEWTKAQAENANISTREKVITPAVRGRPYSWKAYIKLADGTLVESTAGITTGTFAAP